MKGYDPKTPRIPMALAAVAMTALTMSLLVLAPASAEVDGSVTYLACKTGEGTCAVSCRGQSVQGDVVGEREDSLLPARVEVEARQPGAPLT
jgi:hypothetical protein